ncbi:FecCD family ABC transporter permease [Microbacterium resistens]|uniref:FecCD family ABC transporter permease n=1 Tax=Microbacterium resistens TaxID=156977 RepID=UPI003672EE5B
MTIPVTARAIEERTAPAGVARSSALRLVGLVAAIVVLAVVVLASIGIGAREMSLRTVWEALWFYDDGIDAHVTIRELRLPRTVVGLVVGPALGVSGALIQAYTRNPLADPGILGVNAGATFAVTAAVGFLGVTAPLGYVWFALLGAAAVTVLVSLLGATGGGTATPAKLTLAGVALSAVLGGVSSAIVLGNRDTFDDLRFWGVGSLGGRALDVVLSFAPLILLGLVLSVAVARSLNALALGDELASSLGVRGGRIRVVVIVAVTLLAGTATALAGPIGFVGLMIPHAVRWFVGPDQRWIIAYTIVLAPILLLVSDILGRVILPSGELRVGLVTAIVGAPVLILLARRRSVSGL